jgi:hypothetical protein
MMRRFLLTASVLLLFVSGWSQVLAASLCSHTPGAHACCRTKDAGHEHGQASSHHEMAMDGMEGMEMPAEEVAPADNKSNAISVGQPVADCAHCLGHSQTQTVPVASITSDQSGRGNEPLAPPVTGLLSPLASAFAPPITSRQHAPPGTVTSRHVLISVFRI